MERSRERVSAPLDEPRLFVRIAAPCFLAPSSQPAHPWRQLPLAARSILGLTRPLNKRFVFRLASLFSCHLV